MIKLFNRIINYSLTESEDYNIIEELKPVNPDYPRDNYIVIMDLNEDALAILGFGMKNTKFRTDAGLKREEKERADTIKDISDKLKSGKWTIKNNRLAPIKGNSDASSTNEKEISD